jgi:hypothetical protein
MPGPTMCSSTKRSDGSGVPLSDNMIGFRVRLQRQRVFFEAMAHRMYSIGSATGTIIVK